jgi:hypothetical protein
VTYQVNDLNPAVASFFGEGEDKIHILKKNRLVTLKASIQILSDKHYFYTTVIRRLFENGKLIRTRTWKERIPRDFQ